MFSSSEPLPVHANNITFSATINTDDNSNGNGDPDGELDPNLDFCLLQLVRAGITAPSTDNTVLDSQNAGGLSAQIRVISNRASVNAPVLPGFKISFEAPTSFTTAPAGGNANVNFQALYSGSSVTDGVNFALQDGINEVTLPSAGESTTQITGHLRAEKTTGTFPAGSYASEAVFRCE